VPPQREVRGGAGFGEREAESHPKRSFPVRKEFVPPGFYSGSDSGPDGGSF